MTTTADLAADLGVDDGDVHVLLDRLDERGEQLPDELAGFLRRVLDPHGERTAAGAVVVGCAPRGGGAATGLGGPDPTRVLRLRRAFLCLTWDDGRGLPHPRHGVISRTVQLAPREAYDLGWSDAPRPTASS